MSSVKTQSRYDSSRHLNFITTAPWQLFFKTYTFTGPSHANNFTGSGALSAVLNNSGVAVTATDCPAGRILRTNGKKLYPDAAALDLTAYPDRTPLVGVFDYHSGLSGFIDPNATVFAIYNVDKPIDSLDGTAGSGANNHRGMSVYTGGNVTAVGNVSVGTQLTLASGTTQLNSTSRQGLAAATTFVANIAANTTLTVTTVLSGVITLGMTITSTGNITSGTYISAFGTGTGGTGTYTISANALGTAPALSMSGGYATAASGTSSTTTSGSTTLTIGTLASGVFSVGMGVTGTGIPLGAYIVSYGTGSGGAGTYIMSIAATANGTVTVTGAAITAASVTANYVAGSTTLTVTAMTSGVLAVGMPISSGVAGLPTGAAIVGFITGAGGVGTYTINYAATAAATGATITGTMPADLIYDLNQPGAQFVATCAGGILTVTSIVYGSLTLNSTFTLGGIQYTIYSFGTGTGGVGTYFVRTPYAVAGLLLASDTTITIAKPTSFYRVVVIPTSVVLNAASVGSGVPVSGTRITVLFGSHAATTTITLGAGFVATGTIGLTIGQGMIVSFVSNGTDLVEVFRTAAWTNAPLYLPVAL